MPIVRPTRSFLQLHAGMFLRRHMLPGGRNHLSRRRVSAGGTPADLPRHDGEESDRCALSEPCVEAREIAVWKFGKRQSNARRTATNRVPLVQRLSNAQFVAQLDMLVRESDRAEPRPTSIGAGVPCRCGCGNGLDPERKFLNQAHYMAWLRKTQVFAGSQ
jgi:hypothetical protein